MAPYPSLPFTAIATITTRTTTSNTSISSDTPPGLPARCNSEHKSPKHRKLDHRKFGPWNTWATWTGRQASVSLPDRLREKEDISLRLKTKPTLLPLLFDKFKIRIRQANTSNDETNINKIKDMRQRRHFVDLCPGKVGKEKFCVRS